MCIWLSVGSVYADAAVEGVDEEQDGQSAGVATEADEAEEVRSCSGIHESSCARDHTTSCGMRQLVAFEPFLIFRALAL